MQKYNNSHKISYSEIRKSINKSLKLIGNQDISLWIKFLIIRIYFNMFISKMFSMKIV